MRLRTAWFTLAAAVLGWSCAPAPQMTHGVATGDVTDHSAIVWARADGPAELVVEMDDGLAFRAENAAESDFTAQVVLDGLDAGNSYSYRAHFENAGGRRF